MSVASLRTRELGVEQVLEMEVLRAQNLTMVSAIETNRSSLCS